MIVDKARDDLDEEQVRMLLDLVSYKPNRIVRVYFMEKNMGAPMARNVGLA